MTRAAQIDSDEEFDMDEIDQINEEIDEEGRSPDFKAGGNARLTV